MHRYLAFQTPIALLLAGLTVHNFHLCSEGGGVSPILHVIHLQLSWIIDLFYMLIYLTHWVDFALQHQNRYLSDFCVAFLFIKKK